MQILCRETWHMFFCCSNNSSKRNFVGKEFWSFLFLFSLKLLKTSFYWKKKKTDTFTVYSVLCAPEVAAPIGRVCVGFTSPHSLSFHLLGFIIRALSKTGWRCKMWPQNMRDWVGKSCTFCSGSSSTRLCLSSVSNLRKSLRSALHAGLEMYPCGGREVATDPPAPTCPPREVRQPQGLTLTQAPVLGHSQGCFPALCFVLLYCCALWLGWRAGI